ncbi:MAG: hypothetical protein IT381_23755 [Deltaproteobacteria bacterium]|nr:hypothetical protein [Deltaproteobacteria bacterium]
MLALSFATALIAATTNPPVDWKGPMAAAMHADDTRALKMTHWRFAYRLELDGKTVDAGFFGYGLADVFKDDPRALKEIRKFQAAKIAGGVAIGLAIASYAMTIAFASLPLPPGTSLGFMYGMFGGMGMFSGLAAGMFLIAPMFLARAVAYKNEQILGLAGGATF